MEKTTYRIVKGSSINKFYINNYIGVDRLADGSFDEYQKY